MVETVGEWKARKLAQGKRFTERYPLQFERWQDYETKFVLIRPMVSALVIGQLPWDDLGQPAIDLTDEQIEEWMASPCLSPA